MKKSRKTKPNKSKPPVIKKVLALCDTGKLRERSRVRAGTTLKIIGTGFGEKSSLVKVLFGDQIVYPYSVPFSASSLMVTAPLGQKTTKQIIADVAGRQSRSYPFVVGRFAKSKQGSGEPTRELLGAIDEYSALVAEFARAVAPMIKKDLSAKASLLNAAKSLDSLRTVSPQIFERWMQWLPLQDGQDFAPLRTVEFYDDIVVNTGLVKKIRENIENTFGAGSLTEQFLANADLTLFGYDIPTLLDSFEEPSWGDIGFIIHEFVKFIKGVENLFKIFKPSGEAGAGVVGVDVEISFGEGISAIAELVDIVAQILQYMSSKESSARQKEKLEQIENHIRIIDEKMDRQEEKQDRIEIQLGNARDDLTAVMLEVDQLAKLLGKSIVGTPWSVHPRVTTTGNPTPPKSVKEELHDIEDKIDIIETKLDQQETKLDRQEEKLDRQEEKLDREEEKLDRFVLPSPPHEGSVASQRGGNERITGTVVALKKPDDNVYMRAAVDVLRNELSDQTKWSSWISFGRPQVASPLVEVSIDTQYKDNSNSVMSAILSVRDTRGIVYHQNFEGDDHHQLMDPGTWSQWHEFLQQP